MTKKRHISTLIACIAICMSFAAQGQTELFWDDYGIGFAVASDFIVQTNDNSEFTAVSSDGEVAISIIPWSDASLTIDDLSEATVQMADQAGGVDHNNVYGDFIELDDFQGYFLVTASENYGDFDYMLAAILLDDMSDTNLAIVIGFYEGNEDEAIEMLSSFYPYD